VFLSLCSGATILYAGRCLYDLGGVINPSPQDTINIDDDIYETYAYYYDELPAFHQDPDRMSIEELSSVVSQDFPDKRVKKSDSKKKKEKKKHAFKQMLAWGQ